ncbi:hypothetical protein K523DRAFT_322696 [Schizophyllum commune Tattone D]|nr:hypothetical protein K523DRAFT_322696 [Schizophyllum commune Tattone D]
MSHVPTGQLPRSAPGAGAPPSGMGKAFVVGGSAVALLLGSWIYSQHHVQKRNGTRNTHELVSKYGGRNNVMLQVAPTTRVPPNLVTAEERGKVHYTIPQFLASDDPSPERRRMQPAPGREAYGRAYTKKGDINGPVNVPLPKLDSPADVV